MPEECKQTSESLTFIKEKSNTSLEDRACANDRNQQDVIDEENTVSPPAALESNISTAVIDAKEGGNVTMVDMPNAFVQTELEKGPDQKKIIVKLRGAVAKMMVRCAPKVCKPCVVFENRQKSFVQNHSRLCADH